MDISSRGIEHAAPPADTGRPLISVVLILFNNEPFLAEAIESVLAQTYGHWELFLCDDGSTDGSTDRAKAYARLHPDRIRYLAHPGGVNAGKNATRNLGIREARGEAVAFLDGDDVWLPNKLERQVSLLEEHPSAAMIYGRTEYWLSWSGDPADAGADNLSEAGVILDRVVPPPLPLIHYLDDEGIYPCMCSIIVRRWLFDEIGLFDEEYKSGSQDMAFHAKVFLNASVYISSECWDRYRIHADSYWGRMRRQGLWVPGEPGPIQYHYLTWLRSYLIAHDVNTSSVWRALNRALRPHRHPRWHALLHRLSGLWQRVRTATRLNPFRSEAP